MQIHRFSTDLIDGLRTTTETRISCKQSLQSVSTVRTHRPAKIFVFARECAGKLKAESLTENKTKQKNSNNISSRTLRLYDIRF